MGVDGTITQDNLGSNESVGFYIRSDVVLASGYFTMTLDDTNGTDQTYAVPAVATADKWTWVEIDVSGCNANCDTTDGVKFTMSAAGAAALGAATINFDCMYKWDAADEETLGDSILQDGVLFILSSPVAAAGLNTSVALTEWSDYIVNYQTSNEAIVWLSDQSTYANTCFYAY